MQPELSTPHLADACMRLGLPVRVSTDLRPLQTDWRINGAARCVRHFGSVDIFLEAIEGLAKGEVLVVDNDGRNDEGCIGDLVVSEAFYSGCAGIVIWGRHRDSAELRRIGLPVFSLGSCASGPARLDTRTVDAFGAASIGRHRVCDGDRVVADEDGVLVLAPKDYPRLVEVAGRIAATEQLQATRIAGGRPLREQLQLQKYKKARDRDPTRTFRSHLSEIGGAIEA